MTREEAIKYIKSRCIGSAEERDGTQWSDAMWTAIEALSAEPKTGEWEIKTETDEYGLKRPKLVCSKCEKEPAAWDLTELFEFCPNCGARMNGEDGE